MSSYGFNTRWDAENQILYFSVAKDVNFPVIISLKEYRSDSVLWSVKYNSLHPGGEYWMVPIAKEIFYYLDAPNFMGMNVCIYEQETETLIYEQPYIQKFVSMPRISLSNKIPYNVNYVEYFIDKKYEKWLNKKYHTVVDVGANVGVFTEYMLRNEYAQKVVAVECDSTALYDLQNNFKLYNNVIVIPKALNTTEKPVLFYESEVNPIISSTLSPDRLQNHVAGTKGDKVKVVDSISIKQLVDMLGIIDLLKIDIEGAEYDILLNADAFLFNNINSLFIECHFFENNVQEKYTRLLERLILLGYSVEEYKQNAANVSVGASECIFATKTK